MFCENLPAKITTTRSKQQKGLRKASFLFAANI